DIVPPCDVEGAASALPLSAQVKASIGRIALLLFGIPRCQTEDKRMITSPALIRMRSAGFPESAYCQYLYSRKWVPGTASIAPFSRSMSTGATFTMMNGVATLPSACGFCALLLGRLRLQPILGMRVADGESFLTKSKTPYCSSSSYTTRDCAPGKQLR